MTELKERQSLQGVRASLFVVMAGRVFKAGESSVLILVQIDPYSSGFTQVKVRTLSQQAQVKIEVTSTNYWLLLSKHLQTSGVAGSRGLNSADRTLSSLSLPFSVLALFLGKWSPSGGRRAVDNSGFNLLSAEERPFFK